MKEYLRKNNNVDVVEILTLLDDIRDSHCPRAKCPRIELFGDGSGRMKVLDALDSKSYKVIAKKFKELYDEIKSSEEINDDLFRKFLYAIGDIDRAKDASSIVFTFGNLEEFKEMAEGYFKDINNIETEEFDIDKGEFDL
jgi:hypothetical protein